MITLYQLPPAHNLPTSVSPYCTKLELYLRLTGREFETKAAYIPKSPNKRVPYVAGIGEGLMADSRVIIETLEKQGPSLDNGLSDSDRALSGELEELVQRDLYYACLYSRFVEPDGWELQKPTVKSLVPWVLAPILVPVIRKGQVKACLANGFENRDDGYARAERAVERVAEALGDKDFVLGDEPHIVDCVVWANTMQNAFTRSKNPARDAVRAKPNVMDYIQRVAAKAELELPPLP